MHHISCTTCCLLDLAVSAVPFEQCLFEQCLLNNAR